MRTDPDLLRPFDWRFGEVSPVGVVTVVDPDSAVFAGHFPDRPVVPGVCLLDMVDRAARASGIAATAATVVEMAKFSDAVLPGDRLAVELGRNGNLVTAIVRTDRGESCRVRLRYEAA
ncbi:hypothetical protein NDR87_03985 [Nocardia sp. CDC159]|uniref:ApeI dehydratase-like domain-containing protein n=1 Tax=Nocardia pulmonis TaxID=2951408 RepID=A0A9X2E508_9NOCA|nr:MULTISPECIES: hypothetical protein [Nocardia]MCM6773178.1 hypothetical protein [Nocardia pulmonis]MCM6785519.1 hypothetical protein [Nocardia sp. CDC159]